MTPQEKGMKDYPHNYNDYESADDIKAYHEGWNKRFYEANWGKNERQTA